MNAYDLPAHVSSRIEEFEPWHEASFADDLTPEEEDALQASMLAVLEREERAFCSSIEWAIRQQERAEAREHAVAMGHCA